MSTILLMPKPTVAALDDNQYIVRPWRLRCAYCHQAFDKSQDTVWIVRATEICCAPQLLLAKELQRLCGYCPRCFASLGYRTLRTKLADTLRCFQDRGLATSQITLHQNAKVPFLFPPNTVGYVAVAAPRIKRQRRAGFCPSYRAAEVVPLLHTTFLNLPSAGILSDFIYATFTLYGPSERFAA